VLDLWAR